MTIFDPSRPDFAPYGFTCERWTPQPMKRADRHNEIELNLLKQGSLTYLLGGNSVTISAGRLAVQVANILRGKNKPVYTPHLDAGDFVVVVNADKVVVTGKKEIQKTYMTYSGWKGGEKYTTVADLRSRYPEMLIHRAVRGMVPKNRLGRVLLTKLKVYKGKDHPHAAQQPAVLVGAK